MTTVQPQPPARTLDQVLCELRDEVAGLAGMLARMSAGAGIPVVAQYPAPSLHFRVWVAQVTATPPVELLGANPDRLAFSIQTPSTNAIYVGDSAAAVMAPNRAPLQSLGFSLTHHAGALWAVATTGTVTVTVIEQWR